MKFKDIDIKALTKKSVEQVYESRMPKEIIKEEEQTSRLINLFDLFPMFKTEKRTFSKNRRQSNRNENLFKDIFSKFSSGDIKTSLSKLNNILGISFSADNRTGKVTPSFSGTTTEKLSELFSSLSIVASMHHAALSAESSTGLLFEPIIAGLLGGSTVGFANTIADVQANTQTVNGNMISPIDYSVKVIKNQYGIKTASLIKALSEDRKVKLLVILKEDMDGGKGWLYNFFQVDLDINYLYGMYLKKDARALKSTDKQEVTSKWFSTYKERINKYRNAPSLTPEEQKAANSIINVINTIQNDPSNETLDVVELMKKLAVEIQNLDQSVGISIHRDTQKKIEDISSGESEELDEAKKTPGKIETEIGVNPADTWKRLFTKQQSADGKQSMGVFYKGSVVLSSTYYESLLQQSNKNTLSKLQELLLPLNKMLNNTNSYFVSSEDSNGVEYLRRAANDAIVFEQAAQKVLSTGIAADQNQQQAPLPESLDLTDEAKMVIELLESYNRRNDG